MSVSTSDDQSLVPKLSSSGQAIIIVTAFLGWFFGGMHMGITSLAMGSAAKSLLIQSGFGEVTWEDREAARTHLAELDAEERKTLSLDGAIEQARKIRVDAAASSWFGFYVCAFLFGAALGGLVFGSLGDRYGRVAGMGASICVYSGTSLLAYFVQSPEQLWVARFVVCMGVGGMWPNGVALMSEAWHGVSRPMLAGVIGTSANVGIFLTAVVARNFEITVESWRWVMLMGGGPIILGVLVFLIVPESPRWLASRHFKDGDPLVNSSSSSVGTVSSWDVFRPPLLGVTLVGILLATVPLLGGWGSANWAIMWADQVGRDLGNEGLKADVGMARSLTGVIGSLLGGWIASLTGRRLSYFVASVGAFASSQYLFWLLSPETMSFLVWFALLGLFNGFFFGWLPLFLPELFETRVRSTGAGVCFNFGRIITAITVFATALLITAFNNDYGMIGRLTSVIYLLGAVGICLVPRGVGGEIRD